MPKHKAPLLVFLKNMRIHRIKNERVPLKTRRWCMPRRSDICLYIFPLSRIMSAMHLSACLIHFTRWSIHRSTATISVLSGPKFMIKKGINYKAGVRSLLTASKHIRLSADITIEKGIDYQPFRSNFPATKLGGARWDSVARKTSCVTTIYVCTSTSVGRAWVTQFRVGSLHGKWKGTCRLPTRERSRASFLQRSMTSLPRYNSQSPQQQESYESQSASCFALSSTFRNLLLDWLGCSKIKSSLRIAKPGFTRDFMKYATLKYNWQSFNEQAVCVVPSEIR